MRTNLPCREDPRKLGIEDEHGMWDQVKFFDHIADCKACSALIKRFLQHLNEVFKEDRKT